MITKDSNFYLFFPAPTPSEAYLRAAMLERIAQGIFQDEAAQSDIEHHGKFAYIQHHLPPRRQFACEGLQIHRLQDNLVQIAEGAEKRVLPLRVTKASLSLHKASSV